MTKIMRERKKRNTLIAVARMTASRKRRIRIPRMIKILKKTRINVKILNQIQRKETLNVTRMR